MVKLSHKNSKTPEAIQREIRELTDKLNSLLKEHSNALITPKFDYQEAQRLYYEERAKAALAARTKEVDNATWENEGGSCLETEQEGIQKRNEKESLQVLKSRCTLKDWG